MTDTQVSTERVEPFAAADNSGNKPAGPPKKILKINRFEEMRTIWSLKSPTSDAEDLLREDFWRVVAPRLKRHDVVHVISDDESWECELRIEASNPDGCEVSIVKKLKRRGIGRRMTLLGDGAFRTEYQGGWWCVIRIKDQRVVISGEATENAAILRWLADQPRRQ